MKKQYYRNWEADILLKDNRGFALVIVLLIFSVLVGIVTEFVYVVHNETVSLYNWRESQRLSLEAQSGIKVGESFLREVVDSKTFTYPDRMDFPVPDIGGDGRDAMLITVIDESGKLNLNKLVYPNIGLNKDQYKIISRLFNILDIDETVVDLIVDWIDKDIEERVSGSESKSKNDFLYSIDELLSIDGISEEIYQKLLPHVTIFGDTDKNDHININSADQFVLMSLSDDISAELAKRIINYRELKPFEYTYDIQKVAGFSGVLGTSLGGRITVMGKAFSVIVNVFEEELQKSISAVIVVEKGKKPEYKYWKEN